MWTLSGFVKSKSFEYMYRKVIEIVRVIFGNGKVLIFHCPHRSNIASDVAVYSS